MSQQANAPQHSVAHVSETALWVAVHRAEESKRKDALFGWRAGTVRKMTVESRRLKRQMPRAWLFRLLGALSPKRVREQYSKFESYFLLLERARGISENPASG